MKLRPFELALAVGFGLMGLFAMALLATYRPAPDETAVSLGGSVLIWGTVNSGAFYQMLNPLYETNPAYRSVQYVQKDPRTFENEVLNALAEGQGPDMLFLPHEKLVHYRTKLLPIPYDSFPMADFRELYIDGAEIFALSDGVYAFPMVVDPLVMYWNRDILATYNFVQPPATWETMVNEMVPTLVNRDFDRTIHRSPLAFGEYQNVANAFSVISMLMEQGGSALVSESDGRYVLQLNQLVTGGGSSMTNAVTFYTNFANPSNPLYSWNRTQSLDTNEFLAEELVFYFGKGSEAKTLASRNPNLNFGLAEVPQGATATNRRTYGSFYGLALLRSAKNPNGSYVVMQELGNAKNSAVLAGALGMAPVHRSVLASGSNDTYGRIIYSSALVARGWLTPDPATTDTIFTQMVEDVLANRARPTESVNDAINRLKYEY